MEYRASASKFARIGIRLAGLANFLWQALQQRSKDWTRGHLILFYLKTIEELPIKDVPFRLSSSTYTSWARARAQTRSYFQTLLVGFRNFDDSEIAQGCYLFYDA